MNAPTLRPAPAARTALTWILSAAVVAAPLPALAAPPAEKEAEPAPSGSAGGTVALLRLEGDDYQANATREATQEALTDAGYTVKGIKRSMSEAADKNKCKEVDDACREKVGAYLNKNAKTPFDFYVYGTVPADGGAGEVVVVDIKANKVAARTPMRPTDLDTILRGVVPFALTDQLVGYQVPAGDLSAEEQAVMDELDEPKKTAEELKAEDDALKKAQEDAEKAYNANMDAGPQAVDLKADHPKYCRKGKAEHKWEENPDGTKDKILDLRPSCKRGPVFGYWQPRSWVALTLTIGAAAGAGLMYGLAAAERGNWRDAKDELDAAFPNGIDGQGDVVDDSEEYARLAGAVSEHSQGVRRNAIIGDVMLGTTVLLAGVLAIIINQDRRAAKRFIAEQKELNISNVQVGPMIAADDEGAQGGGLAATFQFGM